MIKPNEKVLMTLMGMEIGGAETHVLELCKALKRTGMQIFVASNGGAYEQELAAHGIVHFNVPLHNKNPFNMLKAYLMLKKIVKQNNIMLVHAHARIPGYLCGRLQKKLRFRFVTTAHWVFSTRFPLNVLTDWGELSLSVSEDINKYLMQNYRVPEKNIFLTINGIDTDKFSPGTNYEPLKKEFPSLRERRFNIVTVSRLDKDRSLTARLLIASVPKLLEINPNIAVYIVGDGSEFDSLKNEAEKMNKICPVVFLTGSRTDIPMWVAAADVFVNASRSALEAMSAGKPLIACGNEGYMGILTEEKLRDAAGTNFCYRGYLTADAEKLTADLTEIMQMNAAEKKRLGEAGREFVMQNYSADKMASDALEVYKKVKASPYRRRKKYTSDVMVSGYYGFNNSGDDMLLQAIVEDMRELKPDIKITVLSMKPRETKTQYGVDAVQRFNLLAVWMRLRKTKMLVTGGGSLIQDETSTQSLLYYLWVIRAASRLGIKNMLYANGVGPLIKQKNIERAKCILNRLDLITTRDEEAAELLGKIGVDAPFIQVTADPAFSLKKINDSDFERESEKYFCVAVRGWSQNPDGFENEIAKFADSVAKRYGYSALFVPMRPFEDTAVSKKIISLMDRPARLIETAPGIEGNNRIRYLTGCAEFVLGMRLHTLIYAVNGGVPVIGIVYDPKILHLLGTFNLRYHMPVSQAKAETLIGFADEIIAERDKISSAINLVVPAEKEKAAKNAAMCLSLLGE
ncbi:MAG: polysaccharide pyruvyl transferase CsaB [Defluviitaleaceae bacterium]|nr:polysaccharide pyruvyl transferase CsaB [Defluviitaleaceae bacterium]